MYVVSGYIYNNDLNPTTATPAESQPVTPSDFFLKKNIKKNIKKRINQ